jgi:hypothetical protein
LDCHVLCSLILSCAGISHFLPAVSKESPGAVSHIKRYLWLGGWMGDFCDAIHLVVRALKVGCVRALLWLVGPWGGCCCRLSDEIAMIPVEVSNARAA